MDYETRGFNLKMAAGIAIMAALVWAAAFAGVIAPNDPAASDMAMRFQSGSRGFPLGTDQLGRCVFSRLIYGARNSLFITFIVLGVSAVAGTVLGMAAGYFGGIIDIAATALIDIFMAFPPFVYIMALVGVLGVGRGNLIISMIIPTWVIAVRMVRTHVQIEKGKNYISSAVMAGSSDIKILAYHILPNILPSLLVFFSLQVGDIILLISGFSFLGIGMGADAAEWGSMISEAKAYIYSSSYLMIYPGMCIFMAVLSFNMIAEGLREKFGM